MFSGFDFETTGKKPGVHAITSIGACCGQHSFHVLVHPHELAEFEAEAMAKNGYDPEVWAVDGVTLEKGMQMLSEFLSILAVHHGQGMTPHITPVAHHAAFDRPFMDWAEQHTGITLPIGRRWRCSLQSFQYAMDAGLIPGGSASLDRLANLAGLLPKSGRGEVHDASYDALLCERSYHWLLSLAKPSLFRRCLNWIRKKLHS